MFGLFKKKNISIPQYEIFLAEVDKYRHIIHKILDSDQDYILIYHFEDTKTE